MTEVCCCEKHGKDIFTAWRIYSKLAPPMPLGHGTMKVIDPDNHEKEVWGCPGCEEHTEHMVVRG